jgi:hypothetical protein
VTVHDLIERPTDLETEILREKVATLVRIANTLGSHVDELHRAREAVLAAAPEERPQRVTRFLELRDLARTWYWYLLVQREAIGIRHHEGLVRHDPIPSLPDPR